MKQFKESITLELSKELIIEVEGIYYPEEPMVWNLPNGDPGYPGSASEFDIEDIRIIKGSLIELIDYIDSLIFNKKDIWEYLTDLTIEKIEDGI